MLIMDSVFQLSLHGYDLMIGSTSGISYLHLGRMLTVAQAIPAKHIFRHANYALATQEISPRARIQS
jgi:hypothetical protein